MNITKDEARILAAILKEGKYELVNDFRESHEKCTELMNRLTLLEKKLYDHGKDKRRQGRKSLNDFDDLLKRFIK